MSSPLSRATKPESTAVPAMPTAGPWSNAPMSATVNAYNNLREAARWQGSCRNGLFPRSKLRALELPRVLP